MTLSVDETDGSRSVTLVTGYEFVRDRERGLGGGGLYKRARDAGTIPAGPAHAVKSDEQQSVCGKTMKMITNNPWPPGNGKPMPRLPRGRPGLIWPDRPIVVHMRSKPDLATRFAQLTGLSSYRLRSHSPLDT